MGDVTEEVAEIIRRSGVQNGFCHVAVMAATAGVVLCAAGESRQADLWQDIERMIPTRRTSATEKLRRTRQDIPNRLWRGRS